MSRVVLSLVFLVIGCRSSETGLSRPGDADVNQGADLAQPPRVAPDKVDILFMMDDSGSTKLIRDSLEVRFPDLVKALDDSAAQGHKASYHIGVVTSDLGAPGISCGKDRGAKLQAVGGGAPAGCLGPVGANYVEYDQVKNTHNLPTAQDLASTLTCMAEVGSSGCGFEMPLESVYRALHDPIPENQGFLRPDAALVVILLTDEDDCSVDPTSDLFTANPSYGNLASFRCTRFGIFCDGAMVAADPRAYTTCTPATPAQGGKLTDMQKYIDFFTLPASQGGVKSDPRNIVVAAIAAPPAPFSTGPGTTQDVCGSGVASCTTLNHSCAAPSDPSLIGDPAVRIAALVNSVGNHALGSVCDTDYGATVTTIGQQIAALLVP